MQRGRDWKLCEVSPDKSRHGVAERDGVIQQTTRFLVEIELRKLWNICKSAAQNGVRSDGEQWREQTAGESGELLPALVELIVHRFKGVDVKVIDKRGVVEQLVFAAQQTKRVGLDLSVGDVNAMQSKTGESGPAVHRHVALFDPHLDADALL